MPHTFRLSEFFPTSPDPIFRTLTDLAEAPRWVPHLVHIERLTQEAFGEGTRWREVRRVAGHEATEEYEVVRYDPPRGLTLRVLRAQSPTVREEYLFTYRLEPQSRGTLVHLEGEIRTPAGFTGFLTRIAVAPHRRSWHQHLLAAKEHAQRNAEP